MLMLLNQYTFSFYNIGVSKWVVEKQTFEIQIVASSQDIHLKEHVELQSSIEQATMLVQASFPPILFDKQGVEMSVQWMKLPFPIALAPLVLYGKKPFTTVWCN